MDSQSFYFDLPKELIAQYPTKEREASRLLVIDPKNNSFEHKNSVKSLLDFIDEDCILVFNNSRVRKARLFGISSTGAKVEFLFLNRLENGFWEVIVSKSRSQKVGKEYLLEGDVKIKIVGDSERGRKIIKSEFPLEESFFEHYGHIPLPPYIKREDQEEDEERYQNVFAQRVGSAAAPTAGLHFSEELLKKLKEKAYAIAEVTLHVGLGTFEPIRSEKIEEHIMHTENYSISSEVAKLINEGRAKGKKIISVGTTTLRVLESATKEGKLLEGDNSTNIFIYPGYQFKMVDALFTNFHTPDSTLFLLVCAFGGKELTMKAYNEAIKESYRFFSYGDATFFKNHI